MRNIRFLEFLSVAIGSAVSSVLSPYFITQLERFNILNSMHISTMLALISAAVVGLFSYLGVKFVFQDWLISYWWYRRLIDPRSKLEGLWIDEFSRDGKKYYAYIEIKFIKNSKEYLIQGHACCEDGSDLATFKNFQGSFYFSGDMLRYFHEADLWDGSKEYVKGCAELQFCMGRWNYAHGKGFFVDFGQNKRDKRTDVIIERLNPKELYKLTGKKKISTNEDYRTLIIAYHKSKCN